MTAPTAQAPLGKLLTGVASAAVLASLAACGGSAASAGIEPDPTLIDDKVLTVCTSMPYEPFEFEKNGKATGFDIDLATEVAAALDVEPKFENLDFDDISSGASLDEDACDVAVAALTINADRAQVVDFSSPYFNAKQVLVTVKDGPITGISQLNGRRIAVQEGSTGELYANDHTSRRTQVVAFKSVDDVDAALSGGTVDAAIYDNNIVSDAIERYPQFHVVEEYDTGEQYGMAVKRDESTDLLRVINDELAAMKKDGRYDAIYKTWFGNVAR